MVIMKRHYVDKWCTKEDMEAEIMQERCQNDLDEFLAKLMLQYKQIDMKKYYCEL